jgi:hypothetical protein
MADYKLTTGQHGAYQKTLAPAVIDTVSFEDDIGYVEILTDGAAAVYVTTDGTDPVPRAPESWEIPAGGSVVRTLVIGDRSGATVYVKLVTAAGSSPVVYSVSGA